MTHSLRSENNHQELGHDRPQLHPSHTKSALPLPRRPSFAKRMIQLVFTRKRSAEENRPKSWSESAAPTATSPSFVRHASANIIIPGGTFSSTLGRASARLSREEETVEGDYCDASWRQRQAHCTNCERLFFASGSGSDTCSSPGRFCSLDCKTSFEYVNHLQEVLAEQLSAASSVSSGSFEDGDSSSDEADYELEDFDADQL